MNLIWFTSHVFPLLSGNHTQQSYVVGIICSVGHMLNDRCCALNETKKNVAPAITRALAGPLPSHYLYCDIHHSWWFNWRVSTHIALLKIGNPTRNISSFSLMHLVQKTQHESVDSDFDMLFSILLQYAVKRDGTCFYLPVFHICMHYGWAENCMLLYFNAWVELILVHSEFKTSLK
jgi:hypothetical protein